MSLLLKLRQRYGSSPSLEDLQKRASTTPLRRELSALHLTGLGIGAIVGAGIFAVVGVVASEHAGPAVAFSFVLAAIVSGISALAYAELASLLPLGGSAYVYTHAALGRLLGWIVGWALLLEYAVGNAAVASSFSDNVTGALERLRILPLLDSRLRPWGVSVEELSTPTLSGGIFDVPAFLIVFLLTLLLLRPVRESARANALLVGTKISLLLLFIVVGAPYVSPSHWSPFFPYGWEGVVRGSALIFFAFIGFDAVSTAAEEARNPSRDLPISILGSLGVTTLLYVAIALVLTGLVPYSELSTGEPLARALSTLPDPSTSRVLALVMNGGALLATVSVLLVFQLGTSRLLFSLGRDGFLPPPFVRVSSRTGTPIASTLLSGAFVGGVAGTVPLSRTVELTNLGTLVAFLFVMISVLVLRRRAPHLPRPFRSPAAHLLLPLGIGLVFLLVASLPPITFYAFFAWMGVGLVVFSFTSPRAPSTTTNDPSP